MHFWRGVGYPSFDRTFAVTINIVHNSRNISMTPVEDLMILQFFNFSAASPYFCLLQNLQNCLRHHRLPWICFFFLLPFFSILVLKGNISLRAFFLYLTHKHILLLEWNNNVSDFCTISSAVQSLRRQYFPSLEHLKLIELWNN